MVCKKCGNELIEGINICPYCGEPSNQEETPNLNIKNLMSDLGNLKIDIDNSKEENEELAVTQDLENLKNEIKALEINNNRVEDVSVIEQDKFINQNVKKIEENNDETPSINDIASNIEEINDNNEFEEIKVPKSNLNFGTIDMSNYIDDNDEEEENDKNENIEDIVDINKLSQDIEIFNPKELDKKEENDEIKILPDEELYNNEEKPTNSDIPDIQNLINDIKNIPFEDTKNKENNLKDIPEISNEEENINTYNLIQDLKSVKVEGIQPILKPEDKKEEKIDEEKSPIKNDYLLKTDIPSPIINNNEDLKNNFTSTEDFDKVETKYEVNEIPEKTEINNFDIEKVSNTEEDNSFVLENLDENSLRLKSDKIRIDDKEEKVYINENLDLNPNSSMVMMPTPEKTPTNTELLNNVDLPQTKTEVTNENNDNKKQQSNFSATMLFICMVVLGIVVVLVVSYVLNI